MTAGASGLAPCQPGADALNCNKPPAQRSDAESGDNVGVGADDSGDSAIKQALALECVLFSSR